MPLLDLCQPASSKLYIFLIVSLNIVTDLYLILIPIPMLWGAQIPKVKKIGLVVLFSGGIFVMVAGLLRCVLILKVCQSRWHHQLVCCRSLLTGANAESQDRPSTRSFLGRPRIVCRRGYLELAHDMGLDATEVATILRLPTIVRQQIQERPPAWKHYAWRHKRSNDLAKSAPRISQIRYPDRAGFSEPGHFHPCWRGQLR